MKMSASRETNKARKYDKGTNTGAGHMQTPTPNQGDRGKETRTGNRRASQRHMRMELLQLRTAHIDFKEDTSEVGAVLGLLS